MADAQPQYEMQPYRRFSLAERDRRWKAIREAKRAWQATFPENGVYICKPDIATADRRYHFEWGDTVHTTPKGAVRMGKAPHGIVISEPRQVSWPQD